MNFVRIAGLVLASLALGAQAQGTASSAKKDLVAKVIQLQKPGIESVARLLVEQPAAQMMQQANLALQRIPPEKRESVGKAIEGDLRKYVEDALPGVTERALKVAPATLAPLLEEKFSEDELKQLITIIESPVNRKYQELGPQLQRVLGEKVVAETKPGIEPKVRALQQTIAGRFKAAAASAPAASAPRLGAPAAPKASGK